MKIRGKDNIIINALVYIAIITILNILGLLYGSLFYFMTFLSGIVMVMFTVKCKEKVSFLSSLLVVGMLFAFSRSYNTLLSYVIYTVAGISIGYSMRSRLSLRVTIAVGAFSLVVSYIIIHLAAVYLFKFNIIEEFFINRPLQYIEQNKQEIYNSINSNPNYTGPSAPAIYMSLRIGIEQLSKIIPGIMMVTSVIISYLLILSSKGMLNRSGIMIQGIEPFSEFKLPSGFALMMLLVQLGLRGDEFEYGNVSMWGLVLINVFIIIGFSFMLQGISLIDFWLKKSGLNDFARVGVFIAALIFMIPFIMYVPTILVIAGLLDTLLDFRKLEAR